MPVINDAVKLYRGTQTVTAAYVAGVKVWPKALQNTLAASLVAITVPGETSAWVQVSTSTSGTPVARYDYYSSTNGGGWVLRYQGGPGPHNFDTTYSSTIRMAVNAFDAAGNFLVQAITNTLTTKVRPIVHVQRTWQGGAVEAASYNGSNQKRTDAEGVASCYYGYFSSNQGQQKSLVRFNIPAEIRNCVSVDRVQLRWYNKHHYYNSGGKVSVVVHHGASLPSTFPGSTGPLLMPTGEQVKWPAPKPGWINNTDWFDVGFLHAAGRGTVNEEVRAAGLQGFGLVGAEGGQAGYGYADTAPLLDITYTVAI